jgi:hypothetical protein
MKKVRVIMSTFIVTESTPMIATFCSIPIYFFNMKNRLSKIAPIVIQIRTILPM